MTQLLTTHGGQVLVRARSLGGIYASGNPTARHVQGLRTDLADRKEPRKQKAGGWYRPEGCEGKRAVNR